MERLTRFLGQYAWILVGVGLLAAVYLLPPDTSLAELRRSVPAREVQSWQCWQCWQSWH